MSVESVPHQDHGRERLDGGGRQDFHPCRGHGNVSAHEPRHQPGLGAGGGDDHVGRDWAGGGLDRRESAVSDLDARDGGVLVEPAAQVITPGYKLVFDLAGASHAVHTNADGSHMVICPDPPAS